MTAPDANGNVVLTHGATVNAYLPTARMINVGPATSTQRVRYDVVNGVLRSTDLVTAGATAQPLASSIVNLKVQYGVDNNNDGDVDEWTAATGTYAPAAVLAATAPTCGASRPRASASSCAATSSTATAPRSTGRCSIAPTQEAVNYTCPAALTGTLPANYRYRVYETIVPLRNPMWNNVDHEPPPTPVSARAARSPASCSSSR